MVERRTNNPKVDGSNPSTATKFSHERDVTAKTRKKSMVRAKFKLQEMKIVASNPDEVSAVMTFNAVYGDGKENKEWSKYTPSGQLTMTVTNPGAVSKFQVGCEYYLDFTKA